MKVAVIICVFVCLAVPLCSALPTPYPEPQLPDWIKDRWPLTKLQSLDSKHLLLSKRIVAFDNNIIKNPFGPGKSNLDPKSWLEKLIGMLPARHKII